VRPVDVTRSEWQCTLEAGKQGPVLRLGLNQISGLQRATAERLLQQREQREFASITELADRVPELSKADLRKLAASGALNPLDGKRKLHRREALWQAERAGKSVGPLLRGIAEPEEPSPLQAMDANERLIADFSSTGVTVGPHPMFYRREEMNRMHVTPASRLYTLKDGERVRVAGSVITRQRPGTAQGFIFLTLEDETGHANVIVTPAIYKENRTTVLGERFLIIDGVLQNTDGVIHIKARRFRRMEGAQVPIRSHDFH
jgi:error-prone DNA polymerase